MRSASYGSVSDDLPGAAAPPLARRARNWRRAGVAAVATLAVLAVAGVIAVRKGAPAALAEGCDEIECMMNSPTQPPGAIKVPPRTLNPDEVEKLKQALAEEEQLESKVSSARRAARGTRHAARGVGMPGCVSSCVKCDAACVMHRAQLRLVLPT